MDRLLNPFQHYAWGSTTAIPAFLGTEPDGRPVAEMWIGAHPAAPSVLAGGGSLHAEIGARPDELLGAEVLERHGARLPFLLKLLAAGAPLSLQVHPTPEQAADGYDREEAAGVALDAPHRSYKDRWHKPELLLALTPVRALCGFRSPAASLAVLDGLAVSGSAVLDAFTAGLRRPGDRAALQAAFDAAIAADPAEAAVLTERLAAAAAGRLAAGSPYPLDDRALVELERNYPGDIGVLLSVLLHHVALEPGECLFLAAGQIHAYLEGLGVEAMASSDNVLRAGLTHKHVDVAELRSVVDFSVTDLPRLHPVAAGPGLVSFLPPVPDVALDVLDVPTAQLPVSGGPRVALGLAGEVVLRRGDLGLVLRPGDAVFLPPAAELTVTGQGRLALVRAQVAAPAGTGVSAAAR